MVELVPGVEGNGHKAMIRVIEGLRESGVELPPLIVTDEPDKPWRCSAARIPADVRRRSVVAVASDTDLLDAVRFEFGGAIRLPVSSLAMETACLAAAGAPAPETPMATRGVLNSVIAGAELVEGIGWSRSRFWRNHIGVRRLKKCLTELATRLGCTPVIIPGPILVVRDCEQEEIHRQLKSATAAGAHGLPSPPAIVPIARLLDVMDFEIDGGNGDEEPVTMPDPQGVLELPSGRRVGSWSFSRDLPNEGEVWNAVAEESSSSGSSWTIFLADGRVDTIIDSPVVAEQWVVKIPGWMGDHLCPGSPSGLLVERLAMDPDRTGRPLWVSNADAAAVRYLLRMPGPIWVDGPGVPVD